MEIYIYFNN